MDTTTRPANGHEQPPTPERIFQALTAYQAAAAMKAAIELDIFTAIAEGVDTTAKLAARCQAAERGVRILADFLTVLQFLHKEDGRYRLVPESAIFLDRNSPAYVGGMSGFLAGPHLVEAFQSLTDSVRKGGTTMGAEGSVTPEHPMWEEFARSMAVMMKMPAEAIAGIVGAAGMGTCKVLDIAAGHGTFGITIARHTRGRKFTPLIGATSCPSHAATPKRRASPNASTKFRATPSRSSSAKATSSC